MTLPGRLSPEQEAERQAFELAWARTPEVLEAAHRWGRFAVPCACGDELCRGWAMDHAHQEALDEEAGRG